MIRKIIFPDKDISTPINYCEQACKHLFTNVYKIIYTKQEVYKIPRWVVRVSLAGCAKSRISSGISSMRT